MSISLSEEEEKNEECEEVGKCFSVKKQEESM